MVIGVPQQKHVTRIALTGFMGSGKTTVGRELAQRLGWSFADLDHAVEAREGLPVPEIFSLQGEPYFRKAEAAALGALLHRDHLVIALGGGAPETAAVRNLLRAAQNTAIVYLKADFDTLYARCKVQAADPGATERPLLGQRDAAYERFVRRMPIYAEVATCIVPAEQLAPEDVAASAVFALRAAHLLP